MGNQKWTFYDMQNTLFLESLFLKVQKDNII